MSGRQKGRERLYLVLRGIVLALTLGISGFLAEAGQARLYQPFYEVYTSRPSQEVAWEGWETAVDSRGAVDFAWVANEKLFARTRNAGRLGPQRLASSDLGPYTDDSSVALASGNQGSVLAWVERDASEIKALQRESGESSFRGNPQDLCQGDFCPYVKSATGLDGSVALVGVENLSVVLWHPNSSGTFTRTVVAAIEGGLPERPLVAVGPEGEVTVVWTVLGELFAASGSLSGGFSAPQRIANLGTPTLDEFASYDVATADGRQVIITWNVNGLLFPTTNRVRVFLSELGGSFAESQVVRLEDRVSARAIDLGASPEGTFVLGMERKVGNNQSSRGRCFERVIPSARLMLPDQSRFGSPVSLTKVRSSTGCTRIPVEGSLRLESAPGDGSVTAFWARSGTLRKGDPGYLGRDQAWAVAEMRSLRASARRFGPSVTFGSYQAAKKEDVFLNLYRFSAWSRTRVAGMAVGNANTRRGERDIVVGTGCSGRKCVPARQLGPLRVSKVRKKGAWISRAGGEAYYNYGVFFRNTGNTRISGIRNRFATQLTGREKGWKRWTPWKKIRSGSLDVGFRGRNDLLLRVPPAGSSYKVKAEIKATGIRKKSVIFRVK